MAGECDRDPEVPISATFVSTFACYSGSPAARRAGQGGRPGRQAAEGIFFSILLLLHFPPSFIITIALPLEFYFPSTSIPGGRGGGRSRARLKASPVVCTGSVRGAGLAQERRSQRAYCAFFSRASVLGASGAPPAAGAA